MNASGSPRSLSQMLRAQNMYKEYVQGHCNRNIKIINILFCIFQYFFHKTRAIPVTGIALVGFQLG